MTFEVRHSLLQDIPSAREIQDVLFPDHPFPYADNVKLQGTLNFVATANGRIIGFTTALLDASRPDGKAFWERARPYVAFVGVLPQHQRHGVGSALLKAVCEAIFRRSWYTEVILECDWDQVPFYEKHGFEEMDRYAIARSWGGGLGMRVPLRKPRPTSVTT